MTTKIFLLLTTLFIVACQHDYYVLRHQPAEPEPDVIEQCRQLIEITEQTIAKAGVKDTQNARIPQYPYLRVNRFLASFRNDVHDQKLESWIALLRDLGLTGWTIELKNLPPDDKTELDKRTVEFSPELPSVSSKLASCSETLSRFDLSQDLKLTALRQSAVVSPEYRTWRQVLGLYPLSALAFRLGIYQWHRQTSATFSQPAFSLPITGELMLYSSEGRTKKLSRAKVANILHQSADNPLQIPMPTDLQQKELFDTFAPGFEIDSVSDNDKIGAPQWDEHGKLTIDTSKPTVYRHVSHTRIDHRILLQLNYLIWFPSRPKTWEFDLLGGQLDGIIWRVTLNPDGQPLIFDSIHACGCYHHFFPSQHAKLSKPLSLYQEPAFAPQNPYHFNENQTVIIRIGANNHYIQKIYPAPAVSTARHVYQFDQANSLRALALTNAQNRSLYDQEGIITGTERNERFLFWPMGIPNPGAMRQWGHHATAFVGRRHFDDARLFEDLLKTVDTAGSNQHD